MNMVPEYSAWPGCPFTPGNMTGFARHGPFKLPVYSLALLFGKKGFLCHNLPLLLALPAVIHLLRRKLPHRPELLCALGWCGAVWLMYSVLSNNSGGACCSVRWFVPFLAPGFFLLAVYLRERPEFRPDFLVLSFWGAVLATSLWIYGPWAQRICPLLWPVVAAALLTWLACRHRNHRLTHSPGAAPEELAQHHVAA